VREARAAVAALDRYLFRIKSFKDAGFELVEQAHLAMSRLEQAVAVRAAPELILLACEIKVAARRGADLLRTYGQYHLLGKLVAWARRGKVEARYGKVTARLRALMPAAAAAGCSTGDGTPTSAAGGAVESPFMGQTASAGGAGARALGAAGSGGGHSILERTVTGGTAADGGAPGPSAPNNQLLRRGRHERVYAVSFAPPGAAAPGGGLSVWWALDSCVEFYSDAAQSTTSFGIEGDMVLTLVAIDGAGNTWGGTNRGTLLVRRPRVWDSQAEERLFASPVRAVAFDAGTAAVWAGDEHGCLRAAAFDEGAWRIQPLLTALVGRVPARGLSAGALFSGASRWVGRPRTDDFQRVGVTCSLEFTAELHRRLFS
jgi:hypothetical protein